MDMLTILATIVLPLLLGYILGRNRDSSKILFSKKLVIYSEIIYEINAHRYLYEKLELDEARLRKLIELKQKLESRKNIEKEEFEFFEKNEFLEESKNFLRYKDKLIKLFAPARLLGGASVVNELREYFSLVSEYYTAEDETQKGEIANKISKSAMELEQLMRKDLGRLRHLSKIDLWWHHRTKS